MKKNAIFILFGFFILGLILYSNILGSFFLSDDFQLIYSVKTNGPLGIWSSNSWSFFRPLISLAFFIDYKLWGLNPTGYHLTNIFFHSLNAFFIFIMASLLLKKVDNYSNKNIVAFFSGFLFLAMPHHTEAVSWISGRCDVIATCLFLSSLCSFLFYKEYKKAAYLLLSLLFFLFGLFSKESVIILPVLIVLFELFYGQVAGNKGGNKLFKPVLYTVYLYFIVGILYIPLRYFVLGRFIGGYGVRCHLNFDPSLILNNLFVYSMRAFLFPDPFAKVVFVLLSIGIILVVILKIKSQLDKARLIFLLAFSFIVSLIPIINLAPWTGDTQGERFIYLPSIFSSIIIAYLLNLLCINRKYFIGIFLSVLIICSVSLYDVNKNWNIAGRISRNIIDSVKVFGKTNMLCIMNIPDDIQGAYIYRNGINHAFYLFAPPGMFNDMCICLYHNIIKEDDVVDIVKIPDSNGYDVKLLRKGTFFYPVNMFNKTRAKCIVGNARIANSLNNSNVFFVLKELKKGDRLIFYSQGAMKQYNF